MIDKNDYIVGGEEKYSIELWHKLIDEVNFIRTRIDEIGSWFRRVDFGYGQGNVFERELNDIYAIYLVVTGRWNSMHLVSWDRGTNELVTSTILPYSRVSVSTVGTKLTINLTANGEWIIYRLK